MRQPITPTPPRKRVDPTPQSGIRTTSRLGANTANTANTTSRAVASSTLRGKAAEQRAEQFLLAQGLRTVTRNYRRKTGEIDLIMQDNATLVFVEVRLRCNIHCGNGSESVTPLKQRRLIRTAQWYLLEHNTVNEPTCRFDVVAYDSRSDGPPVWIRNAFYVN